MFTLSFCVQMNHKNKEYQALSDERKLMMQACLEIYPDTKKKITKRNLKEALSQLSDCMKGITPEK